MEFMQALQIFFRLGSPVFPDEARAQSAKLLEAKCPSLTSAMMNYADSGSTITDFPPVLFGRLHDGFRLIGIADAGAAILRDITPHMAEAWSLGGKRAVQLSYAQTECAAEWLPYKVRYVVPRLVVQKKAGHLKHLADPSAGQAHIERVIRDSMKRQANAMGVKLPDNLDISFVGCAGEFAAKNGRHPVAFLGLREATFEANVRLQGIWALGYLISKGYGHLDANLSRVLHAGQEEATHALSN